MAENRDILYTSPMFTVPVRGDTVQICNIDYLKI